MKTSKMIRDQPTNMVEVVLSRKRKGSDNRQLPDDGMVTAEYPEEGRFRAENI